MTGTNWNISTPHFDIRKLASALARPLAEKREDIRLEWSCSWKTECRIRNEVGYGALHPGLEPLDPELYQELLVEVEKQISARGWKLKPNGTFSGCQLQDLAEYPRLAVCTSCMSLKLPGRWEEAPFTCPCTEEARWSFQKAWLCKCCGQVLLRNISKFSVWFCVGCMPLVQELNARLGRYAIPIGGHSIHGGITLRHDSSNLDVEIFAAKLRDLDGAMKSVDEWGKIVKRRVVAERWPACPPGLIPIVIWDRRLDRDEQMRRFGEMISFLSGNMEGPA